MELAKKVLEYWHLIETLSPNDFPEVTNNETSKSIRIGKYLYYEDKWNDVFSDESIQKKFPILFEQIDYCVGKISKEVIVSSFFEKIGRNNPNVETIEGDICLFGFITNEEDEKYIDKTFRISPFIWSINRLISKQPIENKNYKEECENSEYISILESDKAIEERIEILFNKLKKKYLSFISENSDIRMDTAEFWSRYIDSSEKNEKSDKIQHESSFFSSFLLSDLELAIENYNKNSLLKDYIEVLNNPQKNKIDIRKDIDEVQNILSAKYMPKAKWPGKFSPALMQQIAINYACKGNPLLSVNGPPGTGKTTLLKEIIAQKVYEFALSISKYNTPDEAFVERDFPQKNDKFKKWYIPDENITKYGILVCSCNNSAVENISLELPEYNTMLKEIKEKPYKSFYEENDIYFSTSATNLLKKKTKQNNSKAWGLISAPLGKSENIFDVVSSIGKETKYRKNEDIKSKQKSDSFNVAKKEFLEQKKIVEFKLQKYSSCVTNEYISRLCYGDKECQYNNPWDIQELDIEREILFYKAINLRKEFILASKCIRDNIKLLFHLWGYKDDDAKDIKFSNDTNIEIFNDLFQTLFTIIPVISTTFASVGNFLKFISKPKQIGLLIVDEAGQATPQNMVGALYRSTQAIVVGDPLQVEPIVTIPKYFNEVISDYELDKYFSQKESVQTFADKMNPIGSYLNSETSDSGKLWVGCPLLVHRRCIEPMFTISNELSYDSSMINQAENDDDFEKIAMFEKSYWFNIKGEDKGKNHSVEEQAVFVVNTIKNRKAKNSKYNAFVISPFSTVIKRIQALLNEMEIKDISCGTVHKFQGKQAEEVFFVLGCSNKTRGAVNWVNSNIVNVAVTRAKFRIYIVGERLLWESNRNFEIAQRLLEDGPIQENKKVESDLLLKNKLQDFINTISFQKSYNICITDILYLIKGTRKCWDKNCNKENPVYAIAANKFLIKRDNDIILNYSESTYTIFKQIVKYNDYLEELLKEYKHFFYDEKLHYLANHCFCSTKTNFNRYQKEEFLFSVDDDTATFNKEINNDNFEIIPIKLEKDIFIEAEIFKTFYLIK